MCRSAMDKECVGGRWNIPLTDGDSMWKAVILGAVRDLSLGRNDSVEILGDKIQEILTESS